MGNLESVIETERSGPPTAREGAELRRGAVRGGAILIGTKLVVQVFAWSVTLLVARFLTPYDYGVMAAGAILLNLGDALAEAGMGMALVRKTDLTDEDTAETFTLCLLTSLALYAALFAIAGPVAHFLRSPDLVAFLRVCGVTLLVVPFRTVPMALLERRLQLGRQSATHAIGTVVQGCLVMAMALMGFGYWSLAAGFMAGQVFWAVTLILLSRWTPRLRMPGASVGGLLAFGFHVCGANLLWFLYSQADFVVVGRIAGPVELGYYALAFQIITIPVNKLASNFNLVTYPVFCRLQHRPEQIRNWYLRVTAMLGVLGIPLFVGMSLVARDAIPVALGTKWLPVVLPFQLLSLAGLFLFFNCTLKPVYTALGRPDVITKFNATCVLLLPAGFALAGLRYGLAGVCMVWVVGFPLINYSFMALTRKITGFGPLDLIRSQKPALQAVSIMTVAVVATQWSLSSAGYAPLRLIASVSAGALTYGVAIWVLGRRTVLSDFRSLLRELRGN
jgi:teichuronic acid exporter